MNLLPQVTFLITLAGALFLFFRRAREIRGNILQGKPEKRNDKPGKRWKKMLLIAFGQQKMFKKPIPAFLHFIIYAGFIIINIEIIEILIDGIFGTHRVLLPILGDTYPALINIFELFAAGVTISCLIFLFRRNVLKIKRFESYELTKWPRLDANIILVAEILLMVLLLTWNSTDQILQEKNIAGYPETGSFLLSQYFTGLFSGLPETALVILERIGWWGHIIGVLAFANYVLYSKHLHIFLAFPNTWYSNLESPGKMENMPEVSREVQQMLHPEKEASGDEEIPDRMGAKDVEDLTWKNLLDAYSCTECGRCTAECPANLTGKRLSPRKIMMDTRDRLEEKSPGLRKEGKAYQDGKSLAGDYITHEELNACTTCNACVEACPVNIDPLSIILQMRRYNAMEEGKTPQAWNMMFDNMEKNASPWAFSQSDRANWREQSSGSKEKSDN